MTARGKQQVSFPDIPDIFADQPMDDQSAPKVEEVQITNDIKQKTVQEVVKKEEQQAVQKKDPRPHIASTPLVKYILIGLVIIALIGLLVYVVKTYFFRGNDELEQKDEMIKDLEVSLMKMKDQEGKLMSTVSQLRRENQLQQMKIDDMKEELRFNGDRNVMKEDSYIIPEADTSKPPSDKERMKQFNEERMRKRVEDVEEVDQDDEPTEMRLDGEVVEQDGEGSDDEYEYEDAEEDVQEDEPIPVTAEMVRPKDGKKNGKKDGKKDGKKKDTMNEDGVDSDLLALVTSQ